MHTPQDVIMAFLELPEKGKKKVRDFVNSTDDDVDFLIQAFDEEYVQEENYSAEDIAKLDRLQEEAEQGINMSGPFEGQEAIDYLTELEKQAQT